MQRVELTLIVTSLQNTPGLDSTVSLCPNPEEILSILKGQCSGSQFLLVQTEVEQTKQSLGYWRPAMHSHHED